MRSSQKPTNGVRRVVGEALEQRLTLTGELMISEVMYHPRRTDAEEAAGFSENDFEFVEIQNIGASTLNLQGYELGEGLSFRFKPLALAAGQHAVLVKNRAAMEFRYGQGWLMAGEFGGTMGNGGERLTLTSPTGMELLDFEFDDQWHPATDGDGYSLTIVDPQIDPANMSGPSAWRASSLMDGSPGTDEADGPTAWTRAPRDLTITIASARRVDLTWQAPTTSPGAAFSYRIYRDGVSIASANTTSFQDLTVSPGDTWNYQVSTVDANGVEHPLSVAARVFVEPIGGAAAFGPGQARGTVAAAELNELSGLIASRLNTNVLWTHNDRGGSDIIYALNTSGNYLGTVSLSGVQSVDWESIAVGPGSQPGVSYIYVGDIGDNSSDRNEIRVFRFAEPSFDANMTGQAVVIGAAQLDVITLQYPDGPRDAEVLFVDPLTGDVFVVAKEPNVSRVYRASAPSLSYDGVPLVMTHVASVDVDTPSGGDISPDGREIILRNEDEALVYSRAAGQTVAQALSGWPVPAPVIGQPTEPNGEAIAYDPSNRGYYTISEEAPILYFFPRRGPVQPGDANYDGRFDSSDLVQVFQRGRYDTGSAALWSDGDWNGDGVFNSSDLVAAFQQGAYEAATEPAGWLKSATAPVATTRELAVDLIHAHAGEEDFARPIIGRKL